jgi:hypothetical protein
MRTNFKSIIGSMYGNHAKMAMDRLTQLGINIDKIEYPNDEYPPSAIF